MDTAKIAKSLLPNILKSSLPSEDVECGKDHLIFMVEEMQTRVVGEKAHRWLGYIQGCLVSSGGATLEEMKKINCN